MKLLMLLTAIVLPFILAGCSAGSKSSAGFHLPDGNSVRGKAAFVELKCHTCHVVPGVELPAPSGSVASPVVLGGDVAKVKTYGELVTAIIHPSYDLSKKLNKEWMEGGKLSPMGSFNDIMTVQQMIDLVAFLQPQYKLVAYEFYLH